MNTTARTIAEFLKSEINASSDLLIHSSLRSIGDLKNQASPLVEDIENHFSEDGTVIMMTSTPTEFSLKKVFDILKTKSEMGILTEVFRERNKFNRSRVPMTSFCALGKNLDDYVKEFNSYLDKSSPFQALLNHNGYIVLVGVDFNRCTLYHLPEEVMKVPYNHYKRFYGQLVDFDGRSKAISQEYFVRVSLSTKKDAVSVSRSFDESSLCKKKKINNGVVRIFKALDYYEYMINALKQDLFCLLK